MHTCFGVSFGVSLAKSFDCLIFSFGVCFGVSLGVFLTSDDAAFLAGVSKAMSESCLFLFLPGFAPRNKDIN